MPRMTAPDGTTHPETSSQLEVTQLRAQGWTASASLTKDGKTADEEAAGRRKRDPRLVPNKKVGAPPVLQPDRNPQPDEAGGPQTG